MSVLSHSSSQANENGRVEPSDLDVIIGIVWNRASGMWPVEFSPQGKVFATAPAVYKVKAEVALTLMEKERNQPAEEPQREPGPDQGAGTAPKQWQELLHNTDPRLTHEENYGFRLMDTASTPAWPLAKKFDDVIRFETHGVSTEPRSISDISHFRLKRAFQGPNQYRLDRSGGIRFHGPLASYDLEGFWGLSTKTKLLNVSDFWKA